MSDTDCGLPLIYIDLHESDPNNVFKIDNRSLGFLTLAAHSWIKEIVGKDLKAFAAFRKDATAKGSSTNRSRTTLVKSEDVMLLTRRNAQAVSLIYSS